MASLFGIPSGVFGNFGTNIIGAPVENSPIDNLANDTENAIEEFKKYAIVGIIALVVGVIIAK